MSDEGRGRAAEELGERLATVEGRAGRLSAQLADACRVAESLKIDVLRSKLEEERRLVARTGGLRAVLRDDRRWGTALVSGAAEVVVGMLRGKDVDPIIAGWPVAASAAAEEAGQGRMAVFMDRRMEVVPRDQMTTGRFWVTWENLQVAMEKLRARALAGEELGDLATVVSLLSQDFRIKRVVVSPIKIRMIPIPEKGEE